MSDHLPLSINLRLPSQISADILFARSLELAESSQSLNCMPSYRFKFNAVPAAQKLQEHLEQIMESCNTNSADFIIETLEDCLIPILKENKIKRKHIVRNIIKDDIYEECDILFNNYMQKAQNCAINEDEVNESYETYQSACNTLDANVFQFHEDKYKIILDNLDEYKLWSEINWSGGHKSSAEYQIPIQVMSNYFKHLFQPLDLNENKQLEDLHTETYIPVTDDPIMKEEISEADKNGCNESVNFWACTNHFNIVQFDILCCISSKIWNIASFSNSEKG